jgi:hypothetical protein
MLNVWVEQNSIHGFCGILLTERDYLEDLELDGRLICKRNFKKWDGVRTGLVWFSIGIGGKLF